MEPQPVFSYDHAFFADCSRSRRMPKINRTRRLRELHDTSGRILGTVRLGEHLPALRRWIRRNLRASPAIPARSPGRPPRSGRQQLLRRQSLNKYAARTASIITHEIDRAVAAERYVEQQLARSRRARAAPALQHDFVGHTVRRNMGLSASSSSMVSTADLDFEPTLPRPGPTVHMEALGASWPRSSTGRGARYGRRTE